MSEETRAAKKLARQTRKHIKTGRLARREAIAGVVFISPWIAGALIFLAYPLITSFWYSLNNIRITPLGKQFTFLAQGNYTEILMGDPDFIPDLLDYLISTIISVPVIVVFALIIAMLLNQHIKGRGFFRAIFFLPVIIVSGPILSNLMDEGAGTISSLDTQTLQTAIESFLPANVADPIASVFGNMVTILWYSGVQILIFLSALQKIDPAMYEAAKIDGGSGWECFWKITLPTIKSMILLNAVYTVVFISNNDQNEIIGLIQDSMFSGVQEKGYGYASAMAWMYSVVEVLLVGLCALLLMGRKDVYERQAKKYRRQAKKEKRMVRKIERRSERHAKKIHKAREKRGYKSYDGSGDY